MSHLRCSASLVDCVPVLTHWANFCRAFGAEERANRMAIEVATNLSLRSEGYVIDGQYVPLSKTSAHMN